MNRDQKREILVEAAEQLFRQQGYRQTSIASIARSTGISTGSVYSCFDGKEALFAAVLDRVEERAVAELNRKVAEFQSPLSRLKALFRFAARGVRSDPLLLRVLQGDRMYRFAGSRRREAAGKTLRSRLERLVSTILAEGARRLVMRPGVFKDPSRLLVVILDSVIAHAGDVDARNLIDDASLMIERGLRRQIRLQAGREQREHRRLIAEEG
jgi:AcrR family transcriptional regulator